MIAYIRKPALNPIRHIEFSLTGKIGELLANIINQWLLPLPLSNPALLEMFYDGNKDPLRNLLPWSGEFAGKYLTGAVQIYRLSGDKRLSQHIDWFVETLAAGQTREGYLGPWPESQRLTGKASNSHIYFEDDRRYEQASVATWDAWDQYHMMLGLIAWYEESGSDLSLRCAMGIGDLLCRTFLTGDKRMVQSGSEEMNLAPIHAFCLLYRLTGEQRYLEMAHRIEEDFGTRPAGDYIATALDGMEFYQTPKPRWESLHSIQGIGELYLLTGDDRYRQAFEHIWWSIAKTDRHNTGGFSTGEGAIGSPYKSGAIETCCTIAWMALSVDMLRMTGNSIIADELELSMLNGGLGSMSLSARWWTYDTPMDGYRKCFYQDHNWQTRPGSPELNCCSANGPKSLGMLCDWAVMESERAVAVNYYGPVVFKVLSPGGKSLVIEEKTDYPATGKISIKISVAGPEQIPIKIRIPHWSRTTRVSVNRDRQMGVCPGTYYEIDRAWSDGDTIDIALDMSLHYWRGEGECEGKASAYRGPILLACDESINESLHASEIPELDAQDMQETSARIDSWLKPWLAFEYKTASGKKVVLCDFFSAGQKGRLYRSWLKVCNINKVEFSKTNPLRSVRYGE